MTRITTGNTTQGTQADVDVEDAGDKVSLGIAGFNILLDDEQAEAVANAILDAVENRESDEDDEEEAEEDKPAAKTTASTAAKPAAKK